MANITLRQNDMSANLSDACYHPDTGFIEDATWQVAEAVIRADSDTTLESGPATIQCGDEEFAVTITVYGHDEDEIEEGDPACMIDIAYSKGLQKLALALGLLDHLPRKQQEAIRDR